MKSQYEIKQKMYDKDHKVTLRTYFTCAVVSF